MVSRHLGNQMIERGFSMGIRTGSPIRTMLATIGDSATKEKRPRRVMPPSMNATASQIDLDLADFVATFRDDPLGFVLAAYPWGEPGQLEGETGPDANQREFLTSWGHEIRARAFDGVHAVMPVRMAETSGHGTGKSAMGAWAVNFIMSTRPQSIGTVTAGTAAQLEDKTWAAIQKWTKLCITSHWWEVQSRGIYARQEILSPGMTPEDWKVVAVTCRPENAQSFAGQHARTSTSWYLFDEASTVDDKIWQVAYGGLTDGEPMMLVWGQPERNTGEFHRVCFGDLRDRWNHRTVDSRTSRFTNKQLIAEWEQDYGIDSDWYKVRVLGLSPSASELQFIDSARVDKAKRNTGEPLWDEPLIAGFDVSGGGAAWNVIRFRKGCDARSIAPIRITGEAGRDRQLLVAKAAQVLSDPDQRVAMMFVDSAFGSPIVERLHMMGFEDRVMEVTFGGASPNGHQANMRAFMWAAMKEWLPKGSISKDDIRLHADFVGPGYHLNNKSQLVIEAKESMQKRGIASPDDGDALALTFAQPISVVSARRGPPVRTGVWS
jgi:hypothetical protein